MEEEEYNLDEMSEDDKDELIANLSDRYNSTYISAATMYNALIILGSRLSEEYSIFKRRDVMQDTAVRMILIAQSSLAGLGVDLEQLEMDAQFENITAQLEEDDE